MTFTSTRDEQGQRVLELAEEGKDSKGIAEAMGCSVRWVQELAREFDIDVRGYDRRNQMRFPNRAARMAFINKLMAEDKTLEEIAAVLGVKPSNLRDYMTRKRMASVPKTGAQERHAAQMEEVKKLLGANMNYSEIHHRTGVHRGTIRKWHLQFGDDIQRTVTPTRYTMNNHKAVENTVLQIEATAASINNVHVSMEGITAEQAGDWLDSLNESMRALNRLRATLREHAHHVQD